MADVTHPVFKQVSDVHALIDALDHATQVIARPTDDLAPLQGSTPVSSEPKRPSSPIEVEMDTIIGRLKYLLNRI